MSQEEADATDGTLIDTYMIALASMNEQGSGGKKGDEEIRRSLGMQ